MRARRGKPRLAYIPREGLTHGRAASANRPNAMPGAHGRREGRQARDEGQGDPGTYVSKR